jgi:homoserine kinase
VQQEQFMESMPYWEPHLKPKIWYSLPCKAKNWLVWPTLTMLPLPFGWIYFGYSPLDIIKIESPSELYATVVHPQIELKSDARSVLKQTVSLKSAIMQWGNVGGLIAGLYTQDYDLIGRSLHDEIVEPLRSVLIPGFDLIKKTAMENGALGSGISGSGPSIFALSKGRDTADKVAKP